MLIRGAHRCFVHDVVGRSTWRYHDVDDRLRQREVCLGAAKKIESILGRVADDKRLRVGKLDVLNGHANNTPRKKQPIPPRSRRPVPQT